MENKVKILLPNEKSVTSEDVDLFLTVDLHQHFKEIKKERFDNDFDLAAQFVKERNASRSFIIYGVLDSTIVDCVGLPIKVYSDPERTDQIATLFPTSIAYDQANVFGKKKAKYFIKLENYPNDHVYFRIETNNFSYRDQDWDQKLVFTDADGNYAPYGTQTIDINSDGNSVTIENDFPFFFNKHWIKLDYNIIEEKKAKVSFNVATQTLAEGQSGQLTISLNKRSPFGLEVASLHLLENTSFSDFYVTTAFTDLNGAPISRIGTQNQLLAPYENMISFIVQAPLDKVDLIAPGAEMDILNGGYIGRHTIMYSSSVTIGSNSDLYQVIVDRQYEQGGTNMTPPDLRFGTAPDITFTLNGQPIAFPMDMYWQVDEMEKTIDFTVNADFEIEFTEFIDLQLTNLLNCTDGSFMQSRILFEDSTIKNYVSLFLGPSYANRVVFSGRTYTSLQGFVNSDTIASYSILRNGHRFEGRNEEFYPNMGYTLKITNSGNRTLFPANPDLGVVSDTFFDIGETRQFYLPTKYVGDQRHSIKLSFRNAFGAPSGLNSAFAQAHDGQPYSIVVNGFSVAAALSQPGYESFKTYIDGGPYDMYVLRNIDRPFDVQYNDAELSAVITSKSPGVKIEFRTNDETTTATTLTSFYEKEQVEYNITLLANTEENTRASYTFSFESNGYRKLTIPRTELAAGATPIPYYFVTGYETIMRPYQDDIDQPYYGTGSTRDDQQYFTTIDTQPSYMAKGSALMNGIAFLADNNIPGTKENLTQYGLGEGNFIAGFLPERIASLPGTFEPIVLETTRKVVDLRIPYSYVYPDPYIRSFDFRFGSPGNETTYTFGGNQYPLTNNAQWWWANTVPATDQTGVALPSSNLQQRLDTGDGDVVGEGPVMAQLVDQTLIRFTSKTLGLHYSVDNIVNYDDYTGASYILAEERVPIIAVGDVNPANNGMGGFAIS